MTPPSVEFHEETGGRLPATSVQPVLIEWITATIGRHGGTAGAINYIFCGDDYLHALNVEYLDHDTLTDIITFPYDTFPRVTGDLFISTERVADNARELGNDYRDELHRVIIHGVLHLCGYGDKSTEEAVAMRNLEEEALLLRPVALLRS